MANLRPFVARVEFTRKSAVTLYSRMISLLIPLRQLRLFEEREYHLRACRCLIWHDWPMSRNPDSAARDLGALHLDDSDPDNLFDSPEAVSRQQASRKAPNGSVSDQTPSRAQSSRYSNEEAREATLRKELENVRNVNTVVENLIGSLERSRDNMDTVHRSVQSAATLLNTWTRILSQTEHNQRLILNPNWRGATRDIEDLENESILKQQAAERRAAEEQMRREAAARQAEEEERKRAAPSTSTRGTRGRVRGTGMSRGPSTSASTSSSIGRGRVSRAGSSIGRGIAGNRARGRGT